MATYLATGNQRAKAITVAALGFAAIFPLHLLFVAKENDFPLLFYGTPARFLFVAAFLALSLRTSVDPPVRRRRHAVFIVVLMSALALFRFSLRRRLDAWAETPTDSIIPIQRGIELLTLLLAGAAAFHMYRSERRTSRVLALAFALAAEQSLFFLFSHSANYSWWTGNLLWAASSLLMTWAVLMIAADAGKPQASPSAWGGAPAIGSQLAEYEILDRLGEGGMGQVFKARHRRLNRVVALKVIRPEQLRNPKSVQRFQREARAAGRLSHANIVQVYDAAEADGTYFLAMEFVEGTDLAALVHKHGPMPVPLACEYVRQASLGLQHAHERGLVHRDIKPSNLLLTASGTQVKILDMGVARFERPDEQDLGIGELTEPGAVMGSPAYLSPEQARDSHHVDIRGDIYSLGCSFYQLLSGHVPFQAISYAEFVLQHELIEPVPIEQIRPDIRPEIRNILRKMMAKRPNERFQSPAEVADALVPFASADPKQVVSWMAGESRPLPVWGSSLP
jgi:tRNA A-37 threonylcarbamoyl transferase component Bud32